MMKNVIRLVLVLFLFQLNFLPVFANQEKTSPAKGESPQQDTKTTGQESSPDKTAVSQHSLSIRGETLHYTATAGTMRLKDESGKDKADMFYIAYTLDGVEEPSRRPITFAFNGGPGASSVWLHLGALGPKRVPTGVHKPFPPPHEMIENQYTWLPFTDLVFIDPIGTGFSRPVSGESRRQFWGRRGDVESVGNFIRLFIARHERWQSPRFMAGESYGTLRATELANYLYRNYGMDFNGLVLISPALSFQTFSFDNGNDLPYMLFLPSYAATAHYHRRLPKELQKDLHVTLGEVEEWAVRDYMAALVQGSSLSEAERNRTIDGLARYTGLSREYIDRKDLRVEKSDFLEELLRDQNLTLGMMDGRVTGIGGSPGFFSDPSMVVTIAPYATAINDILRRELRYDEDLPYVYFSTEANGQWEWGSAIQGYVSVMDSLAEAIRRTKHLRVFVITGYYDLNTPYSAAKYTINHLGLDANLRSNITLKAYKAGHMMYTDEASLKELSADVSSFMSENSEE